MWENVKNKMPKQNEYVLVHTPFCKYKCAVAFWNGVEWRSADDKTEVWNINNWMKLPDVSKL
jgi:hypothetical protein